MVIYACKRLIFAPKCPKYDPIVLNKCTQHCQLCTNNTPTGVIVSAMHAKNSLYGSCATAITLQVIIQPWCMPLCYFTMPTTIFIILMFVHGVQLTVLHHFAVTEVLLSQYI